MIKTTKADIRPRGENKDPICNKYLISNGSSPKTGKIYKIY